MIDRPLVHMFWLGGNIPQWAEENQKLWKKKFGNAFRFWDDARIKSDLSLLPAYKGWPPAMAVDLFRVDVVMQQSGWYVDADVVPIQPHLFEMNSVVLVREDPRRFCNGIFYAPTDHPFLRVWKQEILDSINEARADLSDVARISGPHALSRAIYLYALQEGVQVCLSHLQTLPWGRVEFSNSRDFESLWSKFFRRHSWLVHVAAMSWRTNSQSSRIGNFFYQLRRSRVGLALDIVRQIFGNASVLPIRPVDWHLITNMDNTVLDSRTGWAEFWVEVHDNEDLVKAVRTLSVGGVVSHSSSNSEMLKRAGWKQVGTDRWVRPRVTQLVSELH